jgi:hypothetical protein
MPLIYSLCLDCLNLSCCFFLIKIPLCVVLFASNVGTSFFHLCSLRYQTNFSGAKSPPVTCSKSRNNWMIASSSLIRYFSSSGTGSFMTLSSAVPVVVSSTMLNYAHSRTPPPRAPARTHGQIQAPREPPN